jgi:outer membrane protein W
MKKLYILMAVFLPVTFLHAQLNKGQWMVGGNAGFAASSQGDNIPGYSIKSTRVQLTPGGGYFFTDKFAAGIRTSFGVSNQKTVGKTPDYNFESTVSNIGVTPFVRYYFLPKTNKINLLADASYTYGTAKVTNKNPPYTETSSTTNQHAYTIAAGPAFFINRNIALEVTALYQVLKIGTNSTQNTFMINAGFQIHL